MESVVRKLHFDFECLKLGNNWKSPEIFFTLMRDHEGLIATELQFQTCSKVSENLVSTRF